MATECASPGSRRPAGRRRRRWGWRSRASPRSSIATCARRSCRREARISERHVRNRQVHGHFRARRTRLQGRRYGLRRLVRGRRRSGDQWAIRSKALFKGHFITSGRALRIDRREVPGLSDNTQYSVVMIGTGGTIVAVILVSAIEGDAAFYEAFAE